MMVLGVHGQLSWMRCISFSWVYGGEDRPHCYHVLVTVFLKMSHLGLLYLIYPKLFYLSSCPFHFLKLVFFSA